MNADMGWVEPAGIFKILRGGGFVIPAAGAEAQAYVSQKMIRRLRYEVTKGFFGFGEGAHAIEAVGQLELV